MQAALSSAARGTHVSLQLRQRPQQRRPSRRPCVMAAQQQSRHAAAPQDLVGFVAATAEDRRLSLLFHSISLAVRQISSRVACAGLAGLLGPAAAAEMTQGGSGDPQKKLDVVAHDIMVAVLGSNPDVAVLASEEADAALTGSRAGSSSSSGGQPDGGFAVVFDPLDGSRNIDVCVPTGTIVGVYAVQPGMSAEEAVLQPGRRLVAAAYALYSSAVMLVLTTGKGTHGFTLDPQTGEFMLSHHDMKVPPRGQIYSLNDARYHDWPPGLQRYIDAIRQGQGQHPQQYSARYICSLVADFHRTLLCGGWCGNPRSHLRLVYECSPLAMLCEQAGGAATDGRAPILDLSPTRLHQRLPLFLGSAGDIAELLSYGDVQQGGSKQYAV